MLAASCGPNEVRQAGETGKAKENARPLQPDGSDWAPVWASGERPLGSTVTGRAAAPMEGEQDEPSLSGQSLAFCAPESLVSGDPEVVVKEGSGCENLREEESQDTYVAYLGQPTRNQIHHNVAASETDTASSEVELPVACTAHRPRRQHAPRIKYARLGFKVRDS